MGFYGGVAWRDLFCYCRWGGWAHLYLDTSFAIFIWTHLEKIGASFVFLEELLEELWD
jgi:hypothetical protein